MRLLLAVVLVLSLSAGAFAADLSHRTGTVTIKVVNSKNQPVAKTLTITQKSSDVLFGSNNSALVDWTSFGNYLSTFNSVNLLTFWTLLAGPTPGQYNPDQVASFQYLMNTFADNGLTVTAHPILYNLSSINPPGVNESHYRNHVKWWHSTFTRINTVDVLNEPYHEPISDNWAPLAWSKEDAPGVRRRVNEYGLLTGEITDKWIATLASKADEFDVIGVQAHVPVPKSAIPSIEGIRANLLKLTSLGKPVHITEISVPSAAQGWTEASQEAFLKELYTLFFETPGVEAILYWDLSDNGAWNPTSGLWRSNGTFKPAWTTINTLIKKTWNSSKSVAVAKTGSTFTGFKGSYVVNGKTYNLVPGSTWNIKLATLR